MYDLCDLPVMIGQHGIDPVGQETGGFRNRSLHHSQPGQKIGTDPGGC